MKNFIKSICLVCCVIFYATAANAQITLPKVIGSNMVLQRNQPVPVWGWAKAGKQVKVTFANQQKTVIANNNGYWKVTFAKMQANSSPQNMTISADTSTITLSNILIGEVWLCSGQSNMEYNVKLMPGYIKPAKGIDSAELELSVSNPQIRLFKVEKVYSSPDVTSTGWHESEGVAVAKFSAVGYFFAKNIYNKLHVPVGVITTSWGGTRIEPWTSQEAYEALPAFKAESAQTPFRVDSVPVGKIYHSMVEPLAPYALHGFLWYQGESNCMINEHDMRYAYKMQALIDSWRKAWHNPKAPFYSVLIAPYYYTHRKDHVPHTAQTLPEFWEQQIAAIHIPYTDLTTVTDLVDDLKNIHPSYKWEVGRRLSLLALNKDYGYKNIEYSGPRFTRMKTEGNKAILYFEHANGLKTNNDQPLNLFEVAGADGNFVAANADIKGNTVVVYNTNVTSPVKVRFAWTETAMPNLTNASGIPALPFRTDGLKWIYVK